MVVLRENGGIGYRDLFEVFSEGAALGDEFPILGEMRRFFLAKAGEIQGGGAEYCRSSGWLNIWWPADEFMFIKLVVEDKLAAFYAEAEIALSRFLARRGVSLPDGLLSACFRLNSALIKLPFQTTDLEVESSWNVWKHYRSVVCGAPVPLVRVPATYIVDRTGTFWLTWNDWFREVVWYGNKKGAYLYASRVVEPQIAGHF
jgi:hypothetical protein